MSPVLLQLISMLINIAIQDAPELITEGKLLIDLIMTGREPTTDEIAQLDAAGQKLSAQVDSDVAAKLATAG